MNKKMKVFLSILFALNASSYFESCQSLAFGGLFSNKIRLDDNSISTCDSSIQQPSKESSTFNRRELIQGLAGATLASTLMAAPSAAVARFVLDDETGDYVEVEDTDWQTEWKQRLDKASSMSKDEIFQAARGAGNLELRTGPESDASKKRRAMSACRDAGARNKAGAGTEKECTARVFSGEVDFLLDTL